MERGSTQMLQRADMAPRIDGCGEVAGIVAANEGRNIRGYTPEFDRSSRCALATREVEYHRETDVVDVHESRRIYYYRSIRISGKHFERRLPNRRRRVRGDSAFQHDLHAGLLPHVNAVCLKSHDACPARCSRGSVGRHHSRLAHRTSGGRMRNRTDASSVRLGRASQAST